MCKYINTKIRRTSCLEGISSKECFCFIMLCFYPNVSLVILTCWEECTDNSCFAPRIWKLLIHLDQWQNCLKDSWNSLATEACNIHCLSHPPSAKSCCFFSTLLCCFCGPLCPPASVCLIHLILCLSCPVFPAVSSCVSVCRLRGWGSSGSSIQVPQPWTCHQRGEA
jgi:hypothetical protein